MAGSDCVDVVLLHEDKILQDHVPADPCPAAVAAELMTVHAFENNTLPVQAHQPVFHFKTPETDAFVDVFNSGACFGVNCQIKVVQHRILRGPQAHLRDAGRDFVVPLVVNFTGEHNPSAKR